MRLVTAITTAAMVATASLAPVAVLAQDARLEVRTGDTVKSLLQRQMGKRVTLVLTTGPEFAGVVSAVGDQVVHLTGLTGREFFDAVVSLEHVGAVLVRVRTQ
jgi:predicted NAD/FAD-binding protein